MSIYRGFIDINIVFSDTTPINTISPLPNPRLITQTENQKPENWPVLPGYGWSED